MINFVHLRVHTEYSLVDGIVRVGDLIDAAQNAGTPAIGMTDRANVFGLVKFYNAALAAGVKPIIGCDLWIRDRESDPANRLTVIVQNQTGYKNLCQLLTWAYLYGQADGLACCRREWLAEANEGLLAISGGMAGDVGQALIAGKPDVARAHAVFWQQTFGDRYYFEVTRCERRGEAAWLAATVDLGFDLNVPLVATNDVRFPTADDFDAHEARVCINRGDILADPHRRRDYTRAQYLKSPAEMVELFADLPEALANSVEIARRATLELDLDRDYLPAFDVPAGHDAASFLRAEAEAGLTTRLAALYPDDSTREQQTRTYRERLEHELGVIDSMGFPGYFLIVADFIRWARDAGVPVGPGRGSGAGSLVAYALGITDIDPLAFDLLFERFLNPERVSMPDFDVDFCMDGRDRVIEYVAERYGTDRVSQIITYGTMAARAVVRDVGRVLGHPFGRIDRLAKQIPFAVDMTLARALSESEELAQTRQNDEEMAYLLDLAQSLEGLSRNPGKHAGGVVIAPTPLTDFSPLYCEPDGSARVTQFDKDDVEAIGLVKFDFLGLRTLTIIDQAERSINARGAYDNGQKLDVRSLSYRDQATLDNLKTGETAAVFQLESAGMRRLIKRLKPDAFEDIVALVALYRPGPLESGMVEDFIDRKHGRTEVVYPHPWLADILAPTYGVILYQEQVMQIAQVLAGYSLGNADLLRRAMGKKKPAEMAKQRDGFLAGAAQNGVDADTAAYIFDLVEKFAGYGFNKSHSAAYALVSYQTAWLKTHFPADFMAATLSADMDNTDKIVGLIDECRRLAITVAAPNVNDSAYSFRVVDAATIRYGLGAIKGLGRGAIEAITLERDNSGVFSSLYDLCRRIDTGKANKRALESLIRAGALDDLGPNRASLMHGLAEALAAADQDQSAAAAGQDDLFGLGDVVTAKAPSLSAVVDWPSDERLRAERDTLGLYLSGHPIRAYESELAQLTHGSIADQVAAMPRPNEEGGQRETNSRRGAIVAGLVIEVRRMNKGRRVIISLDDGSGRIECPLFEDKAAAYGDKLTTDKLVVIEGTLQYDAFSDAFRLNPNRIMDLAEARSAYASRVLLDVTADAAPDVEALADCVDRYNSRFGCEIVLRYANAEAEAVLTFEDRRVEVCGGFIEELNQLISADSVQVRYRRALDA